MLKLVVFAIFVIAIISGHKCSNYQEWKSDQSTKSICWTMLTLSNTFELLRLYYILFDWYVYTSLVILCDGKTYYAFVYPKGDVVLGSLCRRERLSGYGTWRPKCCCSSFQVVLFIYLHRYKHYIYSSCHYYPILILCKVVMFKDAKLGVQNRIYHSVCFMKILKQKTFDSY